MKMNRRFRAFKVERIKLGKNQRNETAIQKTIGIQPNSNKDREAHAN